MALAGIVAGQQPGAFSGSVATLDTTEKRSKVEIDEAVAVDRAISGLVHSREKFIPVARFAIVDRLTQPGAWVADAPADARRLFQFLALWRKQRYIERTFQLQQAYEPFSPDSDLLVTRQYSPEERAKLQKRVIDGIAEIMEAADYEALDARAVLDATKKETHYGLDLDVDLTMFEELSLFYSGNISRKELRRAPRKLYLRKEEYVLPIFQRLCIVFKVRDEAAHIAAAMKDMKLDEAQAKKHVKKQRALLPPSIKANFIYMKLFKDIPKSDVEMVFPNTKVKFRMLDKVRLGVTTSSGLGMGIMATLTKVAVAVGVFAWFGALIGLGLIIFRQIMNFVNTKNKYLVTMARNLYSHALADNGGVIELIAGRAAEQDTKEDIILYSVLVKDRISRAHVKDVDEGIESFLNTTFGVSTDFETEESLARLMADGLVVEDADGMLTAMAPVAAARRVDALWDQHLDTLVADGPLEGREIEGFEPTQTVGEKMESAEIDLI